MTRKPRKQRAGRGDRKPEAPRGKAPATGNKQVAEQMRKILRTHYAAKYRVR
jgi:hypothetical protein